MNSYKNVYLKRGKEESLLRFHPWIFSGALHLFEKKEEDKEQKKKKEEGRKMERRKRRIRDRLYVAPNT